jgi:4-hydroxy-3-methylbut-2-enyl diphosphate reductase
MTPSLLILVPLRIEQAALGTPPGSHVLRTGMGPNRARIAAARALGHDAPALAVTGLCAAIDPGLRAGDVIYATELRRYGAEPTALPESALLLEALRRRGLRVQTGPLFSADRILDPNDRRRLAGEALGVDMESAWLATGAAGRPLAVVRVVADAAGRHLADPRMAWAGARALLNMRRVGAALAEWGLTVGSQLSARRAEHGVVGVEEPAAAIVELAQVQRGARRSVSKAQMSQMSQPPVHQRSGEELG